MNLTTPSYKLYPMRATGPQDTLLDLTTAGDFASKPATGVVDLFADSVAWTDNTIENTSLTHNLKANGIEIHMAASAAANKNLKWYLTSWRNENGFARRVAEGTAITGTQAVVKYPHNGATATNMFWCDTIVVTFENWPKEVETTDEDGNDSVAGLWFDACGYRYWMLEIEDGDSSSVVNTVAYYGRW